MTARHHGLTLLELMLALAIGSLLIAGMTASLNLSVAAAERAHDDTAEPDEAAAAIERLLADLQHGIRLNIRDGIDVHTIVPDRSQPADGVGESICYAWSGTPGDPLTRTINAGQPATIAHNVQSLSVTTMTRTIPARPVTDTVNPYSWGYFATSR